MGLVDKIRGTSLSDFFIGDDAKGIRKVNGEIALYDSLSGQKTLFELLKSYEALREMYEPTGFPNRTDSDISFDNGTMKFTIAPTGSEFYYYIRTEKYIKDAADEVYITDTEGLWIIYYDGSTLTASQSIPSDIFSNKAIVAWLYWDATNNKEIYLGDERHGYRMMGGTHGYIHEVFGARWVSGIGPEGMSVDGTGNDDVDAQIGFGSGVIRDEDLRLAIASISSITAKKVYSRDGANGYWRLDDTRSFPVLNYSGGSGRLAWNELTGGVWQQTEVTNNGCVLAHAFATNDSSRQVIFIQGQNTYATIVAARDNAANELSELLLGDLPFVEFTPIATFIFQTSNGYSNTPKARLRSTGEGDYIDWRKSERIEGVAGGEGLTADQHKTLRQLIHFINEGPAEGFVSGAYKEVLPADDPFPTSVIWWESSGKTKKIVEKTITRSGGAATNVTPTPIVWDIYDTDGTTKLATVSDAVTYSGIYETDRLRTITVY